MLRKLALLAALGPVLWLSTATAIGLGEIEVKSGLNQRFAATIPLTDVSPEETDNIIVNLASVAEFQRAGLDRTEYLGSLRFNVASDGGAPRVEVRSTQIAREPFVNFLVEVRARGGRLLREYTILLDPPTLQAPPPVVQAPRAPAPAAPRPASSGSEFFETSEESVRRPTPAPTPAPAVESPAPTPAPAAPLSTASGEGYGPVQPKETFWSIATKLRPDPSLTMDQVLLSIYEANRGSFDGGINGLRVGSRLAIPSASEMGSVAPAAAKARVNSLRRGGSGAPPRAKPRPATDAAAEPPIPAPKREVVSEAPALPASPSPKPAPAIKPAPAPKPLPAPAPKPVPKVEVPPPAPAPAPAPKPEPKLEPKPAPVPAPAPAPVAEPAPAPAPVEPPPASEAPVAPVEGQVTEVPVDAPADAPAEPAPVEPTPAREPAPVAAAEEEGGLLDLAIPVLGLLMVLGGVGYLVTNLLKKRRERQGNDLPVAGPSGMPSVPPAIPNVRSTMGTIPPPGVKLPPKSPDAARRELENLDDTLSGEETADFRIKQVQTQQVPPQRQSSTQVIPPTPKMAPIPVPVPPSPSSLDETTQLPTFDATQAFGAEDLAFARKAVETGNIDFDVTGQFAAETVQINLDANDPMAEADFHLAYGLYDEAILLLRQASGRDPARTELKVKLAETYFAAGRPLEFQETAEGLKGKVDDTAWQKIAIMGQQLCPDAQVFKGGDTSAVSTDFDLGFDEPAVASMPEPVASEALPSGLGNALDFKLEELELPPMETAAPKAKEPTLKNDDALEFDLGDFDLGGSTPGKAVPAPAAAPAAKSRMDDTNALEFDLAGFDSPAATTITSSAMEDISVDEIKLDDFDIGDLGGDSDTISGVGDEASTKLDLARAYVDMGDNEMARNLLNEVLQQGSDAQKGDAKALLARLG